MYVHQFWWRHFPQKELTKTYFSLALRSFALSLMSIFLPIYLYQEIGLSLTETILFFIYYSLIFAFTAPLAAKFAARYGARFSLLLSVPFYLGFIALLYFLPVLKFPLLLIGSLAAVSLNLYWMGLHLIFEQASDQQHRGEEVGKRTAWSMAATIAGPFLGGFLIEVFGFRIVFVLVALLLLLSAVCFRHRHQHFSYSFSLKEIFKSTNLKNALFFISRGTETMAYGVVWPLFIFLVLEDYLSLGIAGTLLSGVSAVLIWLSGKYSDQVKKRSIVRWVAGFESLSWLLRAFASSVLQVYSATVFGAVTHGLREAPLGALEYDKAKGNLLAYFVSREIFICTGRALILVVVLLTNSLSGGLIFQGVAGLAALLF